MNDENTKFLPNFNLDNQSHNIEVLFWKMTPISYSSIKESKESNDSSLLNISEKRLSPKRKKVPETGINLGKSHFKINA